MKKVSGNILNNSFLSKSLQPPFIIVYYFKKIIIGTDNQNWEN